MYREPSAHTLPGMKSQARVHSVKEPVMLKLAKHAVAIVVVAAAAIAPVAARAEIPSFSYTHVVVTNTVQDDRSSPPVKAP
jgi:hypothetical protein